MNPNGWGVLTTDLLGEQLRQQDNAYRAGHREAEAQLIVLGGTPELEAEITAHQEQRRTDRKAGKYVSAAFHAGIVDVLRQTCTCPKCNPVRAFTARQQRVSVLGVC